MKILVATPTYLPTVGGAEVGIFEIFRRLAARHDVTIATPLPDSISGFGEGDSYFNDSRLKILRYRDRTLFERWPKRLKNHLRTFFPDYSVVAAEEIRAPLARERYDIVNCQYIGRNMAVLSALKKLEVPCVLSVVGREFTRGPGGLVRQSFLRSAARAAKHVVYISRYMRAIARMEREDDTVIYYGVDLDRYSPAPRNQRVLSQLQFHEDDRIIFTVQRLSRIKRIDVLIEAFSMLLRSDPDLLLVIAGEGGDRSRLESIASRLGVADRIRWCGYVPEEDLPLYYRAAEVVAFHSMEETFGVVVAQAMASGRPLVTVASSALTELVQPGVTGLLARPADPVDLAGKIGKVLHSEKLAESLSTEGRRFAEANFSWDDAARKYEVLFEDVLRGER